MKVLFYPIINLEAIRCNRIYCDYMLDCLFHGLRSELGADCVDYIKIPIWYNTVNRSELYGNGFTVYGLLDDIEVDRDDLDSKIASNYFDQIIVGIHNNRFNWDGNVEIVERLCSYGNNVKVICGNDSPKIDLNLVRLAPLFKRELFQNIQNVHPISFAIPKEKVCKPESVFPKTKHISGEMPNHKGVDGWKIKNEEEYYEMYRQAYYGITYMKGGWDSLRHYEILMNGCIPLFLDIAGCPQNTLTSLPKDFLKDFMENNIRINDGAINVLHNDYQAKEIIYEMLEWTERYCTTKALAEYVLETGNA